MLKEKYQELIDLGKEIDLKTEYVKEEDGKLKIKGTTPYQLEKNIFWDKIKSFSNWENEISADIRIASEDIYGIYEVKSGDTLSKISKKYLGDPMRYNDIFKLNTDILTNPDMIKVGQKLKIPNK